MKSLIIVRHAKSSWDLSTPNDFDRPLNERGKHDAPLAAKRLIKKGIQIDAFLTSPARRAKKTAKCFIREYGLKKDQLVDVPSLYLANTSVLEELVKSLDASYKTVAIFSHNPGVTEFANTLTEVRIDNIPTCGIFAVQADIKSWEDFPGAEKKFWFFDYPKLHGS